MCYFPVSNSFAQLQRVEIPSSFNPVGSGARALGMGGAFIAVADDATAASWNPGGLIQLETPEVSVVGAYFYRTEDILSGTNPEVSGEQSVSDTRVNYLSAAYPFTLKGHNMIVSANYQNLYNFNREWNFPLRLVESGLSLNQVVDYQQQGNLSAFGLAYCVQINPQVSVGFTVNIWEDGIYDNEWDQVVNQPGSGVFSGFDFISEFRSVERFSFSGINANLGVLWNINSKITLGAVFKTPFTADLEHTYSSYASIRFPSFPAADSISISPPVTENEELDMPMSYGVGLAYRFSDAFTASMDIYRTEWDDFIPDVTDYRETH
jgi:long-subunit fatty acid transport protein